MNLLKAFIFRDPTMRPCGISWITTTGLVSRRRDPVLGGSSLRPACVTCSRLVAVVVCAWAACVPSACQHGAGGMGQVIATP